MLLSFLSALALGVDASSAELSMLLQRMEKLEARAAEIRNPLLKAKQLPPLDHDLGASSLRHFRSSIRRSIVDDHNAVISSRVGHHGREKPLQMVHPIPIEDGHGRTTRFKGRSAHELNAD